MGCMGGGVGNRGQEEQRVRGGGGYSGALGSPVILPAG